MRALGTSGDLAADRRYAYAKELLESRDFAAAADLFRQTLELTPAWPPAMFGLGEALDAAGDAAGAILVYRDVLAAEPEDALGAGVRLARLGALPAHEAMTPGYVAALFDQYAPRFDMHLISKLGYRGPAIILEALGEVCAALDRPLRFSSAMDLGCGTGLMAAAIAAHADAIEGVDLSPSMVRLAAKTGHYRTLRVGDAADALGGRHYPLILAADMLVYVNDVNPLLQAVAQALEDKGLFAFTFQTKEGPGAAVGDDLRQHHSEAHMREAAALAGLAVVHAAPCATRLDRGAPVPGMVMVLMKAPQVPPRADRRSVA